MFVSAERVLRVAIGTAQARLTNLLRDGSLTETSLSAYRGGMDMLRVGPLGGLPGASRLVRVQLLDPVYRGDAMAMGMRWEAVGVTGGLFPVLDADIILSPEGSRSTRLAITGCYRPPFGGLGVTVDRVLMHTVAALTLRSAVTSLATSLEDAAPCTPDRMASQRG